MVNTPLEILVVDDSRLQAEASAEVIEFALKANVTTKTRCEDALDDFKARLDTSTKYSIVFTDYNMEYIDDMDGIQLCEHIKQLDPKTKVVLITGYASGAIDALDKVSENLRPDKILEKPVDWERELLPYLELNSGA